MGYAVVICLEMLIGVKTIKIKHIPLEEAFPNNLLCGLCTFGKSLSRLPFQIFWPNALFKITVWECVVWLLEVAKSYVVVRVQQCRCVCMCVCVLCRGPGGLTQTFCFTPPPTRGAKGCEKEVSSLRKKYGRGLVKRERV